jgi:hypothetical protein
MSRTNHYRICDKCTTEEPCERHNIRRYYYNHKPIREILGRRTWRRKQRYPEFSIKGFMNGPPRWWWQDEHSKARALYRRLMHRDDDPVLPPENKIIDLWGWY